MRATAFRGALRGAKTQVRRATAAAASQVQRQSTRWCRAAQSHKNMSTPWEVQCQCGCLLVLPSAKQFQPRIRIHFEIRPSGWRLQDRRAPSDLRAPGIKRAWPHSWHRLSSLICRMRTCDRRPWLGFRGPGEAVIGFLHMIAIAHADWLTAVSFHMQKGIFVQITRPSATRRLQPASSHRFH